MLKNRWAPHTIDVLLTAGITAVAVHIAALLVTGGYHLSVWHFKLTGVRIAYPVVGMCALIVLAVVRTRAIRSLEEVKHTVASQTVAKSRIHQHLTYYEQGSMAAVLRKSLTWW